MKASSSRNPRERGSSSILVIVAVISFIVIVGLMIRSASDFSSAVDKEVAKEEGSSPLGSSLDVFNSFDSTMESVETVSEPAPLPEEEEKSSGPPMHLTDRPIKEALPEEQVRESNVEVEAVEHIGRETARENQAEAPAELIPWEPGTVALTTSEETSIEPSEADPAPETPPEDDGLMPMVISSRPPAAPMAVTGLPRRARQSNPVNRLRPPLFSRSDGTYPANRFPMQLRLANPNKKDTAQILYSFDATTWTAYDGNEIELPPNAKVLAYCESLHPNWNDSDQEVREFLRDGDALRPPRVGASALQFDERINREVMVNITHSNGFKDSRIEYRLNAGDWMDYGSPLRLTWDQYRKTGAVVEARVVSASAGGGIEISSETAIEVTSPEAPKMVSRPPSEIEGAPSGLGAHAVYHGFSIRGGSRYDPGEPQTVGSMAPSAAPTPFETPLPKGFVPAEAGAEGQAAAD